MPRHLASRVAIVLAIVSAPTPALRAQVDHDFGVWTMLLARGSFDSVSPALGDVRWWLDIQPRFTESADQFLVRPGLGYQLTDNLSGWLGYAWVRTWLPQSTRVDEHLVWQQLLWTPRTEAFRFVVRPRLEQRFVETGSDTGWRLRQFVGASYPLPGEPRLALAAYDEIFFSLNDTDWGAQSGVSQNRLFAGLTWQLSEEATIGAGYLNLFLNRRTTDRMNHLISINLFLTF